MTKLTQKYFDRLHQLLTQDQKCKSSLDYKAGYEYANGLRRYFERQSTNDIKQLVIAYEGLNMPHAYGIARVCRDILQARKVAV